MYLIHTRLLICTYTTVHVCINTNPYPIKLMVFFFSRLLLEQMNSHPPNGLVEGLESITLAGHTVSCYKFNEQRIFCSHLPLSYLYCNILQLKFKDDTTEWSHQANCKQLLDMFYQALEPIILLRCIETTVFTNNLNRHDSV